MVVVLPHWRLQHRMRYLAGELRISACLGVGVKSSLPVAQSMMFSGAVWGGLGLGDGRGGGMRVASGLGRLFGHTSGVAAAVAERVRAGLHPISGGDAGHRGVIAEVIFVALGVRRTGRMTMGRPGNIFR